MSETYSTYEAKAKFSEVLRKVRAGKRVRIAYRGREIAEIAPIAPEASSIEDTMRRLEEEGVLDSGRSVAGRFAPLARRRGALKRFLESRE